MLTLADKGEEGGLTNDDNTNKNAFKITTFLFFVNIIVM